MDRNKFAKINIDENLTEKVKTVLGLEYDGLKKYFTDVFLSFNKNRATVFVTRRCLLLARIFFEDIIENSKFLYDSDGEFPVILQNNYRNYLLSDKADLFLLQDVKEIYIVDDICIHGNTLEKFARDLKLYFSRVGLQRTIVTCVYLISEETIVQVPKIYYKSTCRAGWSDLSQRIVNAINLLNIPYVSSLHTWSRHLTKQKFAEILSKLTQIKQLEVSPYVLEQYDHKKCYYIFEKTEANVQSPNIKCFRLYYNDLTETIVFVPYVILSLKVITTDEFSYGQTVPNKESKRIITLRDRIYNDHPEHALLKPNDYYFNLQSCLYSYIYGLYFIERYLGISKQSLLLNYQQDISGCVWMSFGNSFIKYLNNLNVHFDPNKIRSLPENEKNNNKDWVLEDTEKEHIRVFVEKICRQSWERLEATSYNMLPDVRSWSIFLYREIKHLKDNGKVSAKKRFLYKQFVCLNLIKLCDMGCMNISTYCNMGECMLKAGELGYVLSKSYLQNNALNLSEKKELRQMLLDPYYRCLFL